VYDAIRLVSGQILYLLRPATMRGQLSTTRTSYAD
jgi:hypothetical protein